MRRDLADVRLAERVFAPHYVEPVGRRLALPATLLPAPRAEGEPLAALEVGARFELLEIAGGWAWGTAPESGLVGYIPAEALEPSA